MTRNFQDVSASGLPLFSVSNWVPKDTDYTGEERDGLEGGKKPKIIVVDDEALIAETVVEILNQEGFAAISAPSGSSAIELAKTVRPSIILSDVIMPGLNGIEMGIKIREIVPTCRVILFSGQAATVDLLERARQQGHRFEILAKPIRPEYLIHVVRSSLPSQ
jgi:CheY-like chemotaxis protein